jgi:predicted TIM-barrel enzyme
MEGYGMAFSRKEVIQRIQAQIDKNVPVVGAGAGTGISAKAAEAGGVDIIIIYNSGRYRMAGRGSLAGLMPYGDANEIVVDMAREVLTIVKDTPVLAGVCGTDPFRKMDIFLKQLKDMGFSGIQNFPTVGLIDGVFRQNLEETNMGYGLEVELVKKARELEMFTTPYVFSVEDAQKMAKAGADMLVAHMGLTTKGSIGASTAKTLDDCVKLTQDIYEAGKAINPDVFVIVHGGPVAEPEDAEYVLQRTKGICGFYGASSIERLPTEVGIKNQVVSFKNIRFK